MGQISSLAALSAPQFQSLTVKPVARTTLALMTPSLNAPPTTQKLHAELPTEAAPHPILPPANSEAIFRGLLPVPPALVQAAEAEDSGQIETLTEVDGISLDGIPYLRDGAVLLDDLPQAKPAPALAPNAKLTDAAETALVTAAAVHPETEAQVDADPALSDHAERAYLDEREISAIRAEPDAPAEPPDTDHPKPDPADLEAAPSVDKRA